MTRSAEGGPAGPGPASGAWLLPAGALAIVLALLWYWHLVLAKSGLLSFPLDLSVYRDAGLIVRHVPPFYRASRPSPLYNWPGPPGFRGVKFIYPPFAALPFALLSYLPLRGLADLFAMADLLAVPAAIWIILGALGLPRDRRRLGLTLLTTAVALLLEPVPRTITLGQVEILLMILIVWDLCQPDRRWWKGAGVGLAAGIKMVPLIFIPYLLLTRRFRQAAVAAGTFAATVLIGFVTLPKDSRKWWLQGLFMHGSYQHNTSYAGNQSLLAIFARAGGVAAHSKWLAAAAVIGLLGLAAATLLDRAGYRVPGMLACALTGLLVSPISWDHHWVWIVLAAPVLVYYASAARGPARWIWLAVAALVAGVFAAWPTYLWGETRDPTGWAWGLIWAPPNKGARESTWHGFQLVVGNAYVLTGLVLLVLLLVIAGRTLLHSRRQAGSAGPVGGEATPRPTGVGHANGAAAR
jgi:alpha-1,2-mannosyltransferase